MDEIKKRSAISLPALPTLRRTPLTESICAMLVLGGGGYAALRLMDLLFRALGVG